MFHCRITRIDFAWSFQGEKTPAKSVRGRCRSSFLWKSCPTRPKLHRYICNIIIINYNIHLILDFINQKEIFLERNKSCNKSGQFVSKRNPFEFRASIPLSDKSRQLHFHNSWISFIISVDIFLMHISTVDVIFSDHGHSLCRYHRVLFFIHFRCIFAVYIAPQS